VKNGKAQFTRVDVFDGAGLPLQTSNWVVANLWSTDSKDFSPHIVMWDPEGQGRSLDDSEHSHYRETIARSWLASMAVGFGRPNLRGLRRTNAGGDPGPSFQIMTRPTSLAIEDRMYRSTGDQFPLDEARYDMPSGSGHSGSYALSYAAQTGIRPISSLSEFEELRKLARQKQPILLIGIERAAIEKPGTVSKEWLGEAGIVTSDGYALFDLRQVDVTPG